MRGSNFQVAIENSRRTGAPLLAFNVVDLASTQGVLDAARALDRPVIVQWSARTVSFYGAPAVAAMFRAAVKQAKCEAFLHLDHCADDAVLGAALDAGFDGVMADGSHLGFDENAAWTRGWVERGHQAGAVVEGELGSIRGAEDGFAGGDTSSTPDTEAYLRFASLTGVDLLGADIGTAHGLYDEAPVLHFDLPLSLKDRDAPGFVVHGCSGLDAQVIAQLLDSRVVKLNYSTDLKLAWAEGIQSTVVGGNPPEPVAALRRARENIAQMARARWVTCGADL